MHMVILACELTGLYGGGAQVLQKASEEDRLVTAALNTHGTRAVQKLIETLATREQVCTTYSVLCCPQREPSWLNCILCRRVLCLLVKQANYSDL